MYRLLCLMPRGRLWHHVQSKTDKIRKALTELFSRETEKKHLSHAVRIFPSYFSKENIKEFCNSPNIDEYLSYIHQKHPDRKDFFRLQHEFEELNHSYTEFNPVNVIYLEAFLHWLTNECTNFNIYDNDYLMEVVNLSRPDKWFWQEDKKEPRVFIYHHGPTNSGKSTSAIEDLRNLSPNQKGIYMAPLRLLAWEYQQKLGNCSLITGQQKEYKNANLISCTIEAAPLSDEYQVAVVDQIQMIKDAQRGWAWTKALLMLKAKRIHLCGDERALGIVTKLIQLTGDVLQQRRYSRLSKLILIHQLFKLQNLEKGDCIINFSMARLIKHRNDINKMINSKKRKKVNKKQEENSLETDEMEQQEKANQEQEEESVSENDEDNGPVVNSNHAAIVYGRLPPQCRKEQAKAFNSDKLPYLVATNAIGMGLNLNIKKIILMDHEKISNDGRMQELQQHEFQQIAGRAGRGKQTGYVQCANKRILACVKKALSTVNETYGIQLQNVQDESSDVQGVHKIQQKIRIRRHVSNPLYNSLLKREMREKENQIKKACFYFTPEFMMDFKVTLSEVMKLDMPIIDTISYLRTYCKLSSLYFLQENKHLKYLVNLLEDNKFDFWDLLIFYNGLALSKPSSLREIGISNKIERAHRDYIRHFVQHRKVPLPSFLTYYYNQNFSSFEFMDQISELQYYFNLLESYVWLWGKYQFAFYQVELAISMKKMLSEKINQILMANKFIQKDKKKSEGTASEPEMDSFDRARKGYRSKSPLPLEKPQFINQLIKKNEEKKQQQQSQKVDKKEVPPFFKAASQQKKRVAPKFLTQVKFRVKEQKLKKRKDGQSPDELLGD